MNRFHALILTIAASCGLSAAAQSPVRFTTTDTTLQRTFDWARDMALSYVHDGSDPVGLWYEAALPGRDAFCMRDVSHQVVGAALLGLDEHNRNMLSRIASNISESKDWCSYWEIDRLDRPAPCDYGNDKAFWYNLPANFDVMRACKLVYDWTGDSAYLTSPEFVDFYRHTAHDYAARWHLSPDSIMSRQRFMNTPEPFDRKNAFHTCRGLPSYAESFSGITVAVDLIGAIMKGYEAYADICRLNGDTDEAGFALCNADAARNLIETTWWDEANKRYNTYYTADGNFHRGEGLPYMLLIDAVRVPDRAAATVADVLAGSWNVENLSAFPAFLYRLGYVADAYRIVNSLPTMKRSDYPEVSYGALEGIVCGSMGLVASAADRTFATCHRPADPSTCSVAEGLRFNGGNLTVAHNGVKSSRLVNNTSLPLRWIASFVGKGRVVDVDGHELPTFVSTDIAGNLITTVSLTVAPGASAEATIR